MLLRLAFPKGVDATASIGRQEFPKQLCLGRATRTSMSTKGSFPFSMVFKN